MICLLSFEEVFFAKQYFPPFLGLALHSIPSVKRKKTVSNVNERLSGHLL